MRGKRGKAAAPAKPPLDKCRIVLSGTFPGLKQAEVKSQLIELGATSDSSVTYETTYLISTQADFDKKTTKIKTAKGLGIPIVGIEWLQECNKTSSKVPEKEFLIGAAAPSPPPPSPKAKTNGSLKRAASPSIDASDDDDAPAPKSKKKKAKKEDFVENSAKGKASEKIKDGAKAKDSEKALKELKAEPTLGDGQVAKCRDLRVPLDEGCPFTSYAVYIDPSGVIFDASLNQTNSSNNNNKFYRIQLLHDASGNYKTWTRWGRVGERGQSAMLGSGSLDDAMRNFEKKFREKSGLAWQNRGNSPKPGKYAFVERSYAAESDDEDGDEQDSEGKANGKKAADWQPPETKLLPEVYKLMQLIFNQQFFAAAMSDMNYDVQKLPLGKLSKATITRGFQTLKDLAALLDDRTLAENYQMSHVDAIEQLSNTFYSVIPHDFGRNRPPIISTSAVLKKEVELLESLSDMKDASLIMKMEKLGDDDMHPADKQYLGLGMQEMTPLDTASIEYQHLQEYLLNTRGATHNANYQVEAIFRVERNGEHERFKKSPFASVPSDRRLLWHGSRCTNYGGILSQGLRIAPPEAPASGYMFGKGIYLADMSSKSANYCRSSMSSGTALLLLCEAELGTPMQQLTGAAYTAAEDAKARGHFSTWGIGSTGPLKWKDASCVHPSLTGVVMPDTSTTPPGATNMPGAHLFYNEYICYDVAQVRLRYLFRVKM